MVLLFGDIWTRSEICARVSGQLLEKHLFLSVSTKFTGLRVQHPSQQAAFGFLNNILLDHRGAGLLHGPEGSGRSALIEQYIQDLPDKVAVAVVDGTRLNTQQLLSGVIERFGYGVELDSADEMLGMLRVITAQQTRSHCAPVLVVRNINKMYPSTLCMLCKLASETVDGQFALRIVLVADRYFHRILESPNMSAIADRLIGDLELKALPEPELPKLIVTLIGETLQEFELSRSRALIGRSELVDIVCDGEFVSRHHALLIRDGDAIVLIDLNSRNGTFINSRRISSKVLRDNDIIMVGDHRIKFVYPDVDAGYEIADTADTAKMKSIGDARRARNSADPDLSEVSKQKG